MLDLVSLSFDYFDKPLLREVQFSVTSGQLLHLRGANGAGKTTLLKLLAGLLQPQKGDILFESKSISKDLVSYQQQLCYIGHKAGINPLLTVKENCFFDLHWERQPIALDKLLADFSLSDLGDEPCYHLSAGQKRRVGLLRLMMSNAKLWLLDEPLVALDQHAILNLMTYLENHLAQGGLVIFTSHQSLPPHQLDYQEYFL